jgi:hypothetical protein
VRFTKLVGLGVASGRETPGPCKSQQCSRLLKPRLCMAGAALSADVLALPMASVELTHTPRSARSKPSTRRSPPCPSCPRLLVGLPLRARRPVDPLPGSVVHMLGVAHVPSRLTGLCSVALSALVPLRLSRSTSLTETLLEVGHSGSP